MLLVKAPKLGPRVHMGVSENRGAQYSTLNSRILITRTPNKVPLIFGNSHIMNTIQLLLSGGSTQTLPVNLKTLKPSTRSFKRKNPRIPNIQNLPREPNTP